MSVDRIYLQRAARDIKESPEYLPYSKVRIIVGEDDSGAQLVYEAGDDSFRTLEITNPYGTQAIANSILAKIQGYYYKPYTADGAILNPAAELGDAVNVGEVYSFIASMDTTFSPLMSATISAPEDSNIDHEYPYVTKENKEVARRINGVRTSFIAELGRITTEISATYETKRESEIKYQQLSSSIMQTASGILQTVSATYETQTASAAKLNEAKGYTDSTKRTLETTISQTASGITQSVSETYETKTASAAKLSEAKGYTDSTKRTLETTIAQTATSITSSVSATYETKTAANAQYSALSSTIQQTATSITQTVSQTYATKTALSQVSQQANKISWLVQSGTSASDFTMTEKAIKLVTDTIDLTGFVTFNQLSTKNDKTIINGGNIQTGTIDAKYINVDSLRVTTVYAKTSYNSYYAILYANPNLNTLIVGTNSSTSWFNHVNIYASDDVGFYYNQTANGLVVETLNQTIHPVTRAKWRLGTSDYPFRSIWLAETIALCPASGVAVQMNIECKSNRVIVAPNLSTSQVQLGEPYSSSLNYALEDIYTRSLHVIRDVSFFGATASTKQTLSTTTQNMGYTSANANNYLTILNNIVGILANKYGLIGA